MMNQFIMPVIFFFLTATAAAAENNYQVFRIKTKKITEDIIGEKIKFPKYTTQLMNLANRNSQATRPKHIGQLSELIQQFDGPGYDEWVTWYSDRHPQAIDEATRKIHQMVVKMRRAMELIDEDMIGKWAQDLILTKTYVGLRFQKSILIQIAKRKDTTFRLSVPAEEAKGIDGFIGLTPVSVKPYSYKSQKGLNEQIDVTIIYYKKVRGGIKVYYDF
jgi:hypothetical protein